MKNPADFRSDSFPGGLLAARRRKGLWPWGSFSSLKFWGRDSIVHKRFSDAASDALHGVQRCSWPLVQVAEKTRTIDWEQAGDGTICGSGFQGRQGLSRPC